MQIGNLYKTLYSTGLHDNEISVDSVCVMLDCEMVKTSYVSYKCTLLFNKKGVVKILTTPESRWLVEI